MTNSVQERYIFAVLIHFFVGHELIQLSVYRNKSCKSRFLSFSGELDHFNGSIMCIYHFFISNKSYFSFKCTTHNNYKFIILGNLKILLECPQE